MVPREPTKEGKENPWRRPPRPLVPSRIEAIALAVILLLAGLVAIPMYLPGLLWRPQSIAIPTDYRPDRANGAYLSQIAGCSYCHTAAAANSEPLAGGRRVRTPFGTLHAPNVTPRRDAGIGGWSNRQFIVALRYGLSPAGDHYYPAFPYPAYAGMAITDILDLKTYLDGVAPSGQRAVNSALAFPFSIRGGVGLWKLLYFRPQPERTYPPWQGVERGRYLAGAVAHCGECHTPRTMLGGLIQERWMAGTGAADFNADVPNITPHRDGIGAWSRAALIQFLETGVRPDGRRTAGEMAHVIEEMTRPLSAADRAAMADYLLSLPPRCCRGSGGN